VKYFVDKFIFDSLHFVMFSGQLTWGKTALYFWTSTSRYEAV